MRKLLVLWIVISIKLTELPSLVPLKICPDAERCEEKVNRAFGITTRCVLRRGHRGKCAATYSRKKKVAWLLLCPICRRVSLVLWRQQPTAYWEDESNWVCCCSRCYLETVLPYWEEMWEDYRRGSL